MYKAVPQIARIMALKLTENLLRKKVNGTEEYGLEDRLVVRIQSDEPNRDLRTSLTIDKNLFSILVGKVAPRI